MYDSTLTDTSAVPTFPVIILKKSVNQKHLHMDEITIENTDVSILSFWAVEHFVSIFYDRAKR